jgi:hypothetical protein
MPMHMSLQAKNAINKRSSIKKGEKKIEAKE